MFDTRSNFHDDDAARRPADPAAVAVLIADSDNQKDHNVKVDTDCWDENQPTSINSDGDLENYNDGNVSTSNENDSVSGTDGELMLLQSDLLLTMETHHIHHCFQLCPSGAQYTLPQDNPCSYQRRRQFGSAVILALPMVFDDSADSFFR